MQNSGPPGDDRAPAAADDQAAGDQPADEQSTQAPETVEAQVGSRTTQDAVRHVVEVEQQALARKRRSGRLRKRQEIREDLHFMLDANLQAGGRGVYSGFRYIRIGGIEVSREEAPYVNAYLPLKVALRYPRLMAFTSLTYEDVFVNEQLAPATMTVIRPGKFRRYRLVKLISNMASLIKKGVYGAGVLVAAAALIWLAMKLKRFR